MRDLPAALKTWKEAESQAVPLVTLYSIKVTDALTVRLVEGDPKGTGFVVYDGETYTSANIKRGRLEYSTSVELPSFKLAISNIDGIAGGLMETYNLEDNPVVITRAPLSSLVPASADVQTFSILDQSFDRKQATFTLGFPNFFRRKLPRSKVNRYKCSLRYETRFSDDHPCGYPSDEFSEDTAQDLVPGADTDNEKVHRYGWRSLNLLNASGLDSDLTIPDALYMATSAEAFWSGVVRTGPFLFKPIPGDFEVFTLAELIDTRAGSIAGILCQEASSGQDSWVFLGRGKTALEEDVVRFLTTEDGISSPVVEVVTDEPYIRLKRTGASFEASHAAARGGPWTVIATVSVALAADSRVGLALSAPSSERSPVSASFPFIQFRSGGLPSCVYTFEDCEAHGNTHHFRGFPGIPRA